jgi:hypothetical protein
MLTVHVILLLTLQICVPSLFRSILCSKTMLACFVFSVFARAPRRQLALAIFLGSAQSCAGTQSKDFPFLGLRSRSASWSSAQEHTRQDPFSREQAHHRRCSVLSLPVDPGIGNLFCPAPERTPRPLFPSSRSLRAGAADFSLCRCFLCGDPLVCSSVSAVGVVPAEDHTMVSIPTQSSSSAPRPRCPVSFFSPGSFSAARFPFFCS